MRLSVLVLILFLVYFNRRSVCPGRLGVGSVEIFGEDMQLLYCSLGHS